MKKGRLKITLRSDLCPGSGYSYAGIIDSDICYDEYGIPYIPARRLKGCLRDSYETILYSNKFYTVSPDQIFGKPGSGIKEKNIGITIDNAYIENYGTITAAIKKTAGEYADTQEILDRFSHVVGQTKIKDGVADALTLRFTRVVNKLSPVTKGEMVFYADVLYDVSNEHILKDIAKATRHVGLRRNRGFGNVLCEFETDDIKNADAAGGSKSKEDLLNIVDLGDGKSSIRLTIKNVAPLMLSSEDDSESDDYISGQHVLGMLAGRYLSIEGKTAESDEFKELFLKGDTSVYSNLYPYKDGKIFYPAPEYVNRLKKTKEYRCVLKGKLDELSEETKDGNLPKRLKGKFLCLENDNVYVYEVKKDIIYHHSHMNTRSESINDSGENDGILYTGKAIRKGQYFSGEIIVRDIYVETIKELLLKDDFFFGKSRTAQYGRCKLVKCEINDGEKTGKRIFKKDDYLLLTLLSDYIPSIDGSSIYKDRLIGCIAGQLSPEEQEIFELPSGPEYLSMLKIGFATGYSGIWNLRKQPIPVVKVGSCVVIKLKKDFESVAIKRIGEHINEGYGCIKISKAGDCSTILNCADQSSKVSEALNVLTDEEKGILRSLLNPIILNRWIDGKINTLLDSEAHNVLRSVTNSSAGRFKLMLMESIQCNKGNISNAFSDFALRIESIKRDNTREAGEKLLEMAGERGPDKKWTLKMVKNSEDKDVKNKLKELGCLEDDLEEALNSKWSDFLMAIIVDRKYNGSEG